MTSFPTVGFLVFSAQHFLNKVLKMALSYSMFVLFFKITPSLQSILDDWFFLC